MKMKPLSIPVELAEQWANAWVESDHHLQARFFTIDADEFRAILEEKHVKKIRLYLGRSYSEIGEFQEKLFVVGVDKEGKNIIKTSEETQEPDIDSTGIYDFAYPCPPTCKDGDLPIGGK